MWLDVVILILFRWSDVLLRFGFDILSFFMR